MRADLFSPSKPWPPLATTLVAAAIVLGGTLLYATALGRVPPYLIHDEAQGALQAHAIATTGRDLSGRLLPMYFTEPEFPPGRDPALIYVTALGLTVLPFSDAGARTPTAMIAVLDLVLMFFAARAIFRNPWAAALAALMLALTPIHFIRGRLLLSPLYSIPFVLGWLWSLGRVEQQPTMRRVAAACVWLALGMYSYLAAVLMMPMYLVMTFAVAIRTARWSDVARAVAIFVGCLVPMALWYLTHPERNSQIVSAYQLNAGRIGSLIGLYWRFFDPSYLFVSGDSSMINTTRTAGLFPMAFAVLLPVGIVALLRSRSRINIAIAAGFLTAPLVSVISGAIEMNRVMFAIPFAVLIATYGVLAMWNSQARMIRVVAAALVVSIVVQFVAFHRDYMSDGYRTTAATWFSGNSREALRELLARSGDGQIYISRDIEWVHRFWRFYAIEAGRLDVIDRTTYVDVPPATAPSGARLICPAQSARCTSNAASGSWHEVIRVPSFDGAHLYVIFESTAPQNKAG